MTTATDTTEVTGEDPAAELDRAYSRIAALHAEVLDLEAQLAAARKELDAPEEDNSTRKADPQ